MCVQVQVVCHAERSPSAWKDIAKRTALADSTSTPEAGDRGPEAEPTGAAHITNIDKLLSVYLGVTREMAARQRVHWGKWIRELRGIGTDMTGITIEVYVSCSPEP